MHEIRKIIILPNRKAHREDVIPPWEIQEAQKFMEIYLLCTKLNVLPNSGGLLDQDSLYVHLAKHAMLCQQEREELDERRRVGHAAKRT